MKVKDIMVRDVVTIRPEETFYDIVELLSEKKISGAPVTKGDTLVGMVSESDIMRFISGKDLVTMIDKGKKEMRDKAAMKAEEFMTRKIITAKPGDDLTYVIKVMNEKNINRMPVIEHGKVVGIITRADVVSIVSEYLTQHPLLRKREHEIDEPTLETNIDKLLTLVKSEGGMSFTKAAKTFDVDESRIEEWAKILEDYKLVRLHYPPIGTPSIKIIKVKHGKTK